MGGVALQELRDWHVSTACAAHDAHNALKRGMRGVAADVADVLKRLHVVTHSLRNGYRLLHCHLKDFVNSAVAFSQESHDPQVVYEHWRALGVDDDAAEALADLSLRWAGGQLLISEAHRGSEGLLENVSSCMVCVFRFRKFSDSRWITVGQGCRSLLAGLGVGLRGLASVIRQSPLASDYYIHGFGQLSEEVLRYAAVAGLASKVPDGASNLRICSEVGKLGPCKACSRKTETLAAENSGDDHMPAMVARSVADSRREDKDSAAAMEACALA